MNLKCIFCSADWNNYSIVINSLNVNSAPLNNIPKNINILVLVHEIIHILGVEQTQFGLQISTISFTLVKSLREYKQLLYDAGCDIIGISKAS